MRSEPFSCVQSGSCDCAKASKLCESTPWPKSWHRPATLQHSTSCSVMPSSGWCLRSLSAKTPAKNDTPRECSNRLCEPCTTHHKRCTQVVVRGLVHEWDREGGVRTMGNTW
jgi:hypothetical protein